MLELTLPTFSLGQYANLMAKADWPECLLNIGRSLDIKRITLKRCHKKIYSYTTIYMYHLGCLEPVFHLEIFSREQAKSECDWVVISSVFVASQSSCFFLCSREQIRQVELMG